MGSPGASRRVKAAAANDSSSAACRKIRDTHLRPALGTVTSHPKRPSSDSLINSIRYSNLSDFTQTLRVSGDKVRNNLFYHLQG